METKQEVSLEILKDKKVQVLITTIYIVDEEEVGSKNFRVCLDVGEIDKAKQYLDESWIEVLSTLWKEGE